MITFHFFNVRDAGTGACFLLETILGIGAVLASMSCGGEAAALSGAAARWPCVTLPTIAWPPSLIVTCCTVTFCSPPVR
jgi:hypothetical protein